MRTCHVLFRPCEGSVALLRCEDVPRILGKPVLSRSEKGAFRSKFPPHQVHDLLSF